MKVLIINTRHYLGGGDSTYSFNLASLLKKNGHDVYFFGMHDERNIPDPNDDLFVSQIDFRKLNKKKSIKNGLYVLSRSIYSKEARNNFSKLLDRVKPDIIHAQNLHGHITPSVILEAKSRNIPVVWTLHDYKMVCPNTHFLIDNTGEICEACKNGKFFNAIRKKCKKNSVLASFIASSEAYTHQFLHIRELVDVFISPSTFLESKLLENGFNQKRVKHVPLFLRDEQFCRSNLDDGYFLFIGKIEPIKGILTLIEAAKLLPKIEFKIAGKISDQTEEAFKSNLSPNINYLGLLNGEEIKKVISRSKAIILPSLWYENQPFAILEAFAARKPVIASDLGGMKELISTNNSGVLFKPGNVHDLKNAIESLIENPQIAIELGNNAFNYVTSIHSEHNHYEKLFEIYESLIKESRE